MRFQPALPARGATTGYDRLNIVPLISTRAPREGSDRPPQSPQVRGLQISTRAPREGSDNICSNCAAFSFLFQPALPARGATQPARTMLTILVNFNPRSPRGERPTRRKGHAGGRQTFQPALPARGATGTRCASTARGSFQPALPARGATGFDNDAANNAGISTRAPREGSDMIPFRALIRP